MIICKFRTNKIIIHRICEGCRRRYCGMQLTGRTGRPYYYDHALCFTAINININIYIIIIL